MLHNDFGNIKVWLIVFSGRNKSSQLPAFLKILIAAALWKAHAHCEIVVKVESSWRTRVHVTKILLLWLPSKQVPNVLQHNLRFTTGIVLRF